MKINIPKIYSTAVLIFFLAATGSAASRRGVQNKTVDVEFLRRAFVRQFGGEFQFIKGELKTRVAESERRNYWVAHIKPKRTGYFTLKYSYQYEDKFYAEGEHEFAIAVGGSSCTRYPQVVREVGYFCLNDTIMVPIRLDRRSNHVFQLESKYSAPGDMEEIRKTYNYLYYRPVLEKIENPLAPHLKYLGKYRAEQLFRNGGGKFTHLAAFEAARPGRFNLVLSENYDASRDVAPRIFPAIPILIVPPGTALTLLVPEEKITYLTKARAYSSAHKNSFESNFLILQPGDVFSAAFLAYTERPWNHNKNKTSELNTAVPRTSNPAPRISRQPFSLPLEAGYNAWIVDYLPD